MFREVIKRLEGYGTGEYRNDLPRALKVIQRQCEEELELTGLHRLVLSSACRRLDQIAGEISERGDTGTIQLAAQLRRFKDGVRV
jgi:hypothetical protein